MSWTGTPSVMQQTVRRSESSASKIASAEKAAGTKITLVFAPVSRAASSTVSKIGTPSKSCPPLPGVTPATTWVSPWIILPVWKRPSRPVMPCTNSRVSSSTSIATLYRPPSRASSTARSAAPSIVSSVCTFSGVFSANIRRPSSAFVPSSRTTMGRSRPVSSMADRSPRATSSPRVMPPKMLNRTLLTCLLDVTMARAVLIFSASAPPPTSQKLAGSPPACATTSSVLITSPAPLPRMPTSPSSLTYCRPASCARCSSGSAASTSCSSAMSSWRYRLELSTVTFASSASTRPSSVATSGLISTRLASTSTKALYRFLKTRPTPFATSPCKPAEQRVYVEPDYRFRAVLGDFLDVHAALGREQYQGLLRGAVHGHREVHLRRDGGPRLDEHAPHRVPPDVHAQYLACGFFGLVGALHYLDAAGLPAPAG